jgi:hypothetical protein
VQEETMTDAALTKPWLKEYPSSIPAEIDISAYANLAEMIEPTASRFIAAARTSRIVSWIGSAWPLRFTSLHMDSLRVIALP